MKYRVEGRLLEVCSGKVHCPCWVGENPDGGTCESVIAWRIDAGTIEGIDVSGRTIALSVHIPGRALKGRWRAVVYVDDQSTPDQQTAMLKVWTGQLGGTITEFVGLIGEVIAVERAPIEFAVVAGRGTLTIGQDVAAEMAPFQVTTGRSTKRCDTVLSTIPGSVAFVGKADHFWRDDRRHGLSKVDLEDHNAIQGVFAFEA
jgi:hypothetical protein